MNFYLIYYEMNNQYVRTYQTIKEIIFKTNLCYIYSFYFSKKYLFKKSIII